MRAWKNFKSMAKERLRRGLGVDGVRACAEVVLSRIELSLDRTDALSRRLERMETQLAALARAVEELSQASRRRPIYASRTVVDDAGLAR